MIWYLFQNLLNVHAQDIYIEILCILSTYINYRAYYILGFSDHKTQNKTKFNYVERAEFARETTNGFANDLLVPFNGDDRLEKIKECIITLYFSHDPSIIDEFMTTKGHESLYNQEHESTSTINNQQTTETSGEDSLNIGLLRRHQHRYTNNLFNRHRHHIPPLHYNT
ncbi:unnamed protein product [Rotaria magnacalcarata]